MPKEDRQESVDHEYQDVLKKFTSQSVQSFLNRSVDLNEMETCKFKSKTSAEKHILVLVSNSTHFQWQL